MDQSDDLTFRVNFGGDGVAKLRDRVKDKLKEFMGDYTDDTLVVCIFSLIKAFYCSLCLFYHLFIHRN